MSRTITARPSTTDEGPRRTPRRPRYADTRAAAQRAARADIAAALQGDTL